MSAEDVEVAKRFDAALEAAFETGDRERVYALFADDIEYTTPHRTLRGLSEVREKLKWGSREKEHLDVELEEGEWQDLGGGHVVSESRMVSVGRRRAKWLRPCGSTSTSGSATERSRATSG